MACFNLFELGINQLNQEEAGNDGPIALKEPDPLESHHDMSTTDDSNTTSNSNNNNALAFGKLGYNRI